MKLLVWATVLMASVSGTAHSDDGSRLLSLPPRGIQEIVIGSEDIAAVSAKLISIFGWQVLDSGIADKTVARLWGLVVDTQINQMLIGDPAMGHGYVRVVDAVPLAQMALSVTSHGDAKSATFRGPTDITVTVGSAKGSLPIDIQDLNPIMELAGLHGGKMPTWGTETPGAAKFIVVRLPVSDVVSIYQRAKQAGANIVAELQVQRIEPYGTLRTFAVTAPGHSDVRYEIFQPNAVPMTASELRDFARPGRYATWIRFNNKLTGNVHWRADGTARVKWDAGGLDEEGTWTIKGDAVCTAWFKLRFNRELCVHHYRLDGDRTQSFTVDGRTDGLYYWQGAGIAP